MLDRDLRLHDRVKTRGGELGRVTEVRDNAVTDCKVIVQRDDGHTFAVGYNGRFFADHACAKHDVVEIVSDAITPVIPLECRPWGDNWKAVRVGAPRDTEHYWSNVSSKVAYATCTFGSEAVYVILEPVTPPKPKTHPGPAHLKGWWIYVNGSSLHLSKTEPQWVDNWLSAAPLKPYISLTPANIEAINLKTLPDFSNTLPEESKIQIGDESIPREE